MTSPAKTATRLRDQMAKDGFSASAIATALMHTHQFRPRLAWRMACGLSQTAVADQYNVRFGMVRPKRSRSGLPHPNHLPLHWGDAEQWQERVFVANALDHVPRVARRMTVSSRMTS